MNGPGPLGLVTADMLEPAKKYPATLSVEKAKKRYFTTVDRRGDILHRRLDMVVELLPKIL